MRENSDFSDTIIAAGYSIKEKNYWKEKLSGDLVKSSFDYDFIKPGTEKKKMETVEFLFSEQLFSKLMWIINKSDIRLQIVLVAELVILLNKFSGNKDIIIGTPIYRQDIESDFINTMLVLRNKLDVKSTFKDFLFQVKQTIVEATENQNYPIKVILNDLNIPYSEDNFPLFDIVILLENLQNRSYIRHVNPNLLFSFLRTEETLRGIIEYNSSVYRRETIKRIVTFFEQMVKNTLFNVDIQISSVCILSGEERKQLLVDFNDTKSEYPKTKTIHELFLERVENIPDNTAVVYESEALTYRELNEKSNRLAKVLNSKGVKPDTIVGIMVERSLEMVLSIFGILKAGGAYLPIATKYPDERVKYILEDSQTTILLTHKSCFFRIGDKIEVLDPVEVSMNKDESVKISNRNTSKDLAYVIYTSGSTGKPKGVMIEHQQVVNLIYGLKEVIYKKYNGPLKVALIAPYEFDASVQQIFGVLLLGHTLYIVPDNTKLDSAKLLDFYKKYEIEITDGTPTHIRLLLENISGNSSGLSIRHFIIAGEVLSKKVVVNLLNSFDKNIPRVTNIYGPTETCVDSTYYDVIKEKLVELETIPIGKPMLNEQIYILNNELELQPIGVPGELCISGAGVSRGYLKRKELTAEKFIENPFIKGSRFYRTGDLAKWLQDGNIEYIGRTDRQVKIRGNRIELGEIEFQLLKHDEIREAVVKVTEENGEKGLCAYIVSNSDLIVSELRDYLLKGLPEQMIPENFVRLDRLPLTSNGKVDRKALDSIGVKLGTGIEFVEPENETEIIIADIWKEVLKMNKVSIHDSFFEIGGNSLSIVRVNSMLKKAVNKDIPLVEMFRYPTIGSLAQYLTTSKTGDIAPVNDRVEAEKKGRDKLRDLKKKAARA